ncbi:hypothetical protein CDAR_256941 [Caerostris darwini]|uniref:Uncharacterized protein n=1 Tax=Caerostris darwini TaxID=1538125 RepID=A0AAV4Q0X2_9ARAC|nr:hypothetical protein CDAR_256941 [Caerostris darwini]
MTRESTSRGIGLMECLWYLTLIVVGLLSLGNDWKMRIIKKNHPNFATTERKKCRTSCLTNWVGSISDPLSLFASSSAILGSSKRVLTRDTSVLSLFLDNLSVCQSKHQG